jgi:hypothetical protein
VLRSWSWLGAGERGEITNQMLISAMHAIAVRQVPLQQSAIARELDRQLEENERLE